MIKLKVPNPTEYENIDEYIEAIKDFSDLLGINVKQLKEQGYDPKNLFAFFQHQSKEIKEIQDQDKWDYEVWQDLDLEINQL